VYAEVYAAVGDCADGAPGEEFGACGGDECAGGVRVNDVGFGFVGEAGEFARGEEIEVAMHDPRSDGEAHFACAPVAWRVGTAEDDGLMSQFAQSERE